MPSSAVRYLAVGVLVAGIASIVWTAVRDDDSGGDTASTAALADTGDDRPSGTGEDNASEDTTSADSASGGSSADSSSAGRASEDSIVAETGEDSARAGTSGGDAAAEQSPPSSSVTAASNAGAEPAEADSNATAVSTATVAPEPIPVLKEADTLTGLDGWLNTSAASLEEIRAANQITVVQFWTFGCRNCKNTLQALGRLYDDFGGRGVEIVGVHSPEFSYEADVDNIIEAAAELNVTWPIALDTNKRNFHRWQEGAIAYWPRVYVIDSDNQVRFDRKGDGRATYEQLYATVEQLLADA